MIRRVRPEEDLVALTALIREAYARNAAAGLRYWATHQGVDDTRRRLARGQGFVDEVGGVLRGTVTLRGPQPDGDVPLYRDPGTWTLHQLAVAPAHQGQGLGRALHDAAVEHARAHGATRIALDTAAPAAGLIALYRRWGYEVVGTHDWRPFTNYPSVLMARSVATGPEPPRRAGPGGG